MAQGGWLGLLSYKHKVKDFRIMEIDLIRSILIGGAFGLVYGLVFYREKKKALMKYLEAAKKGQSLGGTRQATIFSLEALLRYVVILGSMIFLIYKGIILPLPSVLSFLVLFWVAIFIVTRIRHEN